MSSTSATTTSSSDTAAAAPAAWRPPPIHSGITYDDVLLLPKHSPVRSRRDVSLRTRLTRNITLNNPIVAANMDSVCEAEMAIAMARNGGIGILHRFLSDEEQAAMVRAVKRAESYKIDRPYTCLPTTSVGELNEMMADKGVGSIVVTDAANTLLGIVTTRDVRFVTDAAAQVAAVMTPRDRLHVAPADVSIADAKRIIDERRVEKLPLVDADGKLAGLITGKDIINHSKRPYASLDRRGQLLVGAAVGVKDGFLERAVLLVEAGVDVLCVDIAHGDSAVGVEATRAIKQRLPHVDLIAGNVATAAGAQRLIEAGADAIKVGVGPGSICITRIVTGCGVPQLTAVLDCASVCHAAGVPLIADGGVKTSGDITKAIAAGASSVMLGSMLAGTDESPGRTLVKDGRKVKIIRGMAGYGANLSKRERERKSDSDIFDMVPEGVEGMVPYRGPVSGVIRQMVGGLCSGISYVGGHNIEELQRNAEFIRVTGAGKRESGSHDVDVI